MKVYGDIERVNLATGERFRRVSGDGESRLVSDKRNEDKSMVFPGEGPLPSLPSGPVGQIKFEARPTVMPVEDKVDPRSWQYPYRTLPMVEMLYEREFLLQSCHFNGQETYDDYAVAVQQRAYASNMKARSPGMTTMTTIEHLESAFDKLKQVLKDVHGHNFRVRVTASQAFPADQSHPAALVWDEELEKVVREWDRTNLSVHPDLEGKRATTEVLCEVLQAKLKKKFLGPHWAVEIWETADIRAVVR